MRFRRLQRLLPAPEMILPDMNDWEVFPREAAAVAAKAVEQGLALKPNTYEGEFEVANKIIRRSREMTKLVMQEDFIPEPPVDDGRHNVDLETIKSAY